MRTHIALRLLALLLLTAAPLTGPIYARAAAPATPNDILRQAPDADWAEFDAKDLLPRRHRAGRRLRPGPRRQHPPIRADSLV
jgi:hypothetical protein